MKKFVLFFFLFSSLVSVIAQETEIIYLSGKDKDDMKEWDFFCTNGRNSGKWSKIGVPSCWELQGFGTYLYGKANIEANEKGLYKYEFEVPSKYTKKRIFIVFEGSMTDTEVKINGELAGPVHQGAFYRFRYEISGLLKYGQKNLLEVTVSKESANQSINRAERISDYWVFGGIFRPVYLEAYPEQFIDRVAIDARANGSFKMDLFINGTGKADGVTARIESLSGNEKIEILTMVPDPSGITTLRGNISNPSIWSPEFPNMYQVIVELRRGKNIVHKIVQKFGFRTVEVKEGEGIYINGVKVMFKGVCRHTFRPSSGRTSSKKAAIEDVNLIKDMNMNAVRMSHYPPDQYFLDVCDSLGLFVLDELAGWQKFYDTPTAKRLIKQMVERDVNHPSIVLWDNGNEGGFNKEVRDDYALYDPQKRTVIEPWSIVNGTNTKHYPGYKYVEDALKNGKEIFFPTEFLHGLYDGGLGAGLDDHWKLMLSSPLSAGAFMWVYADEGVERRDLKDSIDTEGNRAPDGIVGPNLEKEGSFYTIKDIWSPVQPEMEVITEGFDGKIPVANHYLYTDLKMCNFSWELIRFENSFPDFNQVITKGTINSPSVNPGSKGILSFGLPSDWRQYDILVLTAVDRTGRHINTWTWNISTPDEIARRSVTGGGKKPVATETGDQLMVTAGTTEIVFDKTKGTISSVKNNGSPVSFGGGLKFAGVAPEFISLKHFAQGDVYIVQLNFRGGGYAVWQIQASGWMKLDYGYAVTGELEFSGITFSYPEKFVTGADLLANGPYHVWKNRLRGNNFGLYQKSYNNTITGESWDYPEFKGYYSNFYGVRINTTEQPISILSGTRELFLHLFTPGQAKFSTLMKGVRGEVNPKFPDGNISVLHSISAIGTKFTKAEAEGPQSQKNKYNGDLLSGVLYFKFGE